MNDTSKDTKNPFNETYPILIKMSLESILLSKFDTLQRAILTLCTESNMENHVDKIVFTDKIYIYGQIWKNIIECLYENFLPTEKYTFDWTIELTPLTLTLCKMTEHTSRNEEYELQKKLLKISDDDIENDFDNILKKIGATKIGLPNCLSDQLPTNLIPKTKKEELKLLLRIMNFPPLGEIAIFINKHNNNIADKLDKLPEIFSNLQPSEIPSVNNYILHYSTYHLSYTTFQKYGFDTISTNKELSQYEEEFSLIKDKAKLHKTSFQDKTICPCCGKVNDVLLPEEVIQYKLICTNSQLCKHIGLVYFDDFVVEFHRQIDESFEKLFIDINKVDKPQCLILVEGDSEEISIPILSLRKNYILSAHAIKVYNSKSKQKVASDFKSFKKQYPNLKIICLLDADATKEIDEIERIIKNNLNMYRIFKISKGTFEDIFDIDASINILNEMYADGENIELSDFDDEKEFLVNVRKILHEKKQAAFDKVKFARNISLKVDINKFPKIIDEIISAAKTLTLKHSFIIEKR